MLRLCGYKYLDCVGLGGKMARKVGSICSSSHAPVFLDLESVGAVWTNRFLLLHLANDLEVV